MKAIVSVILAFALAATSQFALAAAAQITAVRGNVVATPQTGATRTLTYGDTVNELETIQTGDSSSVVLRFEDGQIAALGEGSRMKISAYSYNFKEPAKGNVVLSLLTGAMRNITGLIGKVKPDRVTYLASTYTIGIRGTDTEIGLEGSKFMIRVINGEISITWPGKQGDPVIVRAPLGAWSSDTALPKVGNVIQMNEFLAANPELEQRLSGIRSDWILDAIEKAVRNYSSDASAGKTSTYTCGVSCN